MNHRITRRGEIGDGAASDGNGIRDGPTGRAANRANRRHRADHGVDGGGALVLRHLGGVLQSQLSASVSRLTAGRAPYVIHNMAQQQRENDYFAFKKHVTVTGHYRLDASKVPQNVLKAWR